MEIIARLHGFAMILDGWGMKMTAIAILGASGAPQIIQGHVANTSGSRRTRHLTPRLDHCFKFESHGDLWIPHFKKPHIILFPSYGL
jgi:hypothetical protein